MTDDLDILTSDDEEAAETQSSHDPSVRPLGCLPKVFAGADKPGASSFDFERIPEEHRAFVRTETASIHERLKKQARDAYFLGDQIREIKRRLGHGLFLEWLDGALGMSSRTAERLMQIAVRLGGKIDKLSNLPLHQLYALTAPSTPDSAIEKCIALTLTGELTSMAANEIVRQEKGARAIRKEPAENDALDLLRALIEPQRGAFVGMLSREKIKGITAFLMTLVRN